MPLITTEGVKCRDCYKCLRNCPVKAIEIHAEGNGAEVHARIIEDKCISDGRCVLICPQNAKRVESNLAEIKEAVKGGGKVAASVAPSFVSALSLPDPDKLVPALKKLGFSLVQETAVGAELVAFEHNILKNRTLISSACPVVVNLVEKHYPQLIQYLSPVVSPMIAHGRLLKQQDPELKVVFIGPCIAKKEEAASAQVAGAVDFVLNFAELQKWLEEEKIDVNHLQPAPFDGYQPDLARLFPVEGGMLRSTDLNTDLVETGSLALTGLENCIEFLKNLSSTGVPIKPGLFELLACTGGCIGGPRAATAKDLYRRREEVISYYNSRRTKDERSERPALPPRLMYRKYQSKSHLESQPSEREIIEILARTGKFKPEDELNCGACGYGSCREKAVAVYRGWAEVQMCIPYMRNRAELLSDRILTAMPNGVVIVTSGLKIISINGFAQRMFKVQAEELIGQELSTLFDPQYFRQVSASRLPVTVQNTYPDFELVTREIIFPLEHEGLVVGILVDITEEQYSRLQMKQMKAQTIHRAKTVIAKQMQVAQEIAGLLGETTAETKMLLSKLIKVMSEEENSNQKR